MPIIRGDHRLFGQMVMMLGLMFSDVGRWVCITLRDCKRG